eukprot:9185437-Alexandrium_andersonii.AAC.1
MSWALRELDSPWSGRHSIGRPSWAHDRGSTPLATICNCSLQHLRAPAESCPAAPPPRPSKTPQLAPLARAGGADE